MLLQTDDWWPRDRAGLGQHTRERLASLFPVASLGATAHTLIEAQEWGLCGRLYEYVLYHKLDCGPLTSRDVLAMSVANARLIGHVWPEEHRDTLDSALTAVADFAGGKRKSRRALMAPRMEVTRLRDGLAPHQRVTAPYRSIEAVVSVLRAAEHSHTYHGLARLATRVLLRAEGAAPRAEVWRPAFLLLDLALSTI